jgi:intergrase/recombinase
MKKSLRNKTEQMIGIHMTKGNTVANVLRELLNYCNELEVVLERQCDSMAFIVNHIDVGNWHDKFIKELEEVRQTLNNEKQVDTKKEAAIKE